MCIARFILLVACAAGTNACLAKEEAGPVQGRDAASTLAAPAMRVHRQVADPSAPTLRSEPRDAIGVPVGSAKLETLRGGESRVDNEVVIDGTVSDNVAEDLVTGSNAITGDAFSNTSGISTVIQNTGNNVLIQNGMVVNVQFVAP